MASNPNKQRLIYDHFSFLCIQDVHGCKYRGRVLNQPVHCVCVCFSYRITNGSILGDKEVVVGFL